MKKPQNKVGPRAPFVPRERASDHREAEAAAVHKPMHRMKRKPKASGRKGKR